MVLATDPTSHKGDRRIRFRMLAGVWRNSWRNSDQTLESRDGCSKRSERSIIELPRKTVSFSIDENSKVTEIPENDDPITPEEVRDSWYHKEDYEKFEKDRVLTSYGYIASKRAASVNFDTEKYSLRGLENLTDDRLGRREAGEKKALRKALKAEEERQKTEQIFPDLARFRQVSLKHSKSARDRAISIAHDDAKRARQEWKEDVLSPLLRLRRWNSQDSSPRSRRRASIG